MPKPDEIELRYSAIGDDATLDSIVAIDVMGDLALSQSQSQALGIGSG